MTVLLWPMSRRRRKTPKLAVANAIFLVAKAIFLNLPCAKVCQITFLYIVPVAGLKSVWGTAITVTSVESSPPIFSLDAAQPSSFFFASSPRICLLNFSNSAFPWERETPTFCPCHWYVQWKTKGLFFVIILMTLSHFALCLLGHIFEFFKFLSMYKKMHWEPISPVNGGQERSNRLISKRASVWSEWFNSSTLHKFSTFLYEHEESSLFQQTFFLLWSRCTFCRL